MKTMTTRAAIVIATLLTTCNIAWSEEAATVSGNSESIGWWHRNFGTLTWAEAKQVVSSPEDAVKLVKRHIRYKADIGDQLTDGKTTWENGFGDCEDIAQCVVELCSEKGWDVWIEVFASKKAPVAHAVVMGRLENSIWIGNSSYKTVNSMDDAKAAVAHDLKWKPSDVISFKWSERDSLNQTITVASR